MPVLQNPKFGQNYDKEGGKGSTVTDPNEPIESSVTGLATVHTTDA